MTSNKPTQNYILYASQDNILRQFHMNAETGALNEFAWITTPDTVQFAQASPCRGYLYVALSNGGPGGKAGDRHTIAAYEIDRASGRLRPHGPLLQVPHRPIHLTVDPQGAHVLVAHNKPAAISVCKLDTAGRLDSVVEQSVEPDAGVFPHQVVVGASGKSVHVCSRGNDETADKPADIGTLISFRYCGGQLLESARFQFPDGVGPRDLEEHPTKALAYVSLERGNQLAVFSTADGVIQHPPLFTAYTLRDTFHVQPRQRAGTVHLHPDGRSAYITNRADKVETADGKTVLTGGENNLAVFALDAVSGKPTLVQHIDSGGIEPRTFAIAPSGDWLVVGNQSPMHIHCDGDLIKVPASLAVFGIQRDGRLVFSHKHDFNGEGDLIWMNFAGCV